MHKIFIRGLSLDNAKKIYLPKIASSFTEKFKSVGITREGRHIKREARLANGFDDTVKAKENHRVSLHPIFKVHKTKREFESKKSRNLSNLESEKSNYSDESIDSRKSFNSKKAFKSANSQKRPIISPLDLKGDLSGRYNEKKVTKDIFGQEPQKKKTIDYVEDDMGEEYKVQTTFEDIGVPSSLIEQLKKREINEPSPIQSRLIPMVLDKRDVIIRCQTGTGKTLGVVIALLSKKRRSTDPGRQKNILKLIITPSVFLARQIEGWIKALSSDATTQVYSTETGFDLNFIPEFAIGTPSAFHNLLLNKEIDLSHVKTIFLDETDFLIKPLGQYASRKQKRRRLRHPNNSEQIVKLIKKRSKVEYIQKIVASATFNQSTRRELKEILNNPIYADEGKAFKVPQQVSHFYIKLNSSDESRVIDAIGKVVKPETSGLIFVDSSASKLKMKRLLKENDIEASLFNSNPERGKWYILGDCEARGIDIPFLDYVIIVGLPETPKHYIHMAGRVGRMNNPGKVINIIRNETELRTLRNAVKVDLEEFQ